MFLSITLELLIFFAVPVRFILNKRIVVFAYVVPYTIFVIEYRKCKVNFCI